MKKEIKKEPKLLSAEETILKKQREEKRAKKALARKERREIRYAMQRRNSRKGVCTKTGKPYNESEIEAHDRGVGQYKGHVAKLKKIYNSNKRVKNSQVDSSLTKKMQLVLDVSPSMLKSFRYKRHSYSGYPVGTSENLRLRQAVEMASRTRRQYDEETVKS